MKEGGRVITDNLSSIHVFYSAAINIKGISVGLLESIWPSYIGNFKSITLFKKVKYEATLFSTGLK